MNTRYQTIPGSVLHVKHLCAALRPAARGAMRPEVDARRALLRTVRDSAYVQTVMLDGKPAAMWGYQCVTLGDHAVAWLALTEAATRFPLAIVRRAQKELKIMAHQGRKLYASVHADDVRALAFARLLGFNRSGEQDGQIVMQWG